jgi:hypothetical protein
MLQIYLVVFHMDLSLYIEGNAEVMEYFDEALINICTQKPTNCLDAINTLDEKVKSRLFRFHFPSTVYPSDELDLILSKYKDNSKYKNILDRYFANPPK